jgi:hypothetical protein
MCYMSHDRTKYMHMRLFLHLQPTSVPTYTLCPPQTTYCTVLLFFSEKYPLRYRAIGELSCGNELPDGFRLLETSRWVEFL